MFDRSSKTILLRAVTQIDALIIFDLRFDYSAEDIEPFRMLHPSGLLC